jgi:heavy metal sensor kinase
MSRAWAPRSIRVRLTVWYAVALTVAMTLYGGGVLVFLRHQLYVHLEGDLRDDIEVAEAMLERTESGRIAWRAAPDEDDEELMAGRWLEVRSPAGELLYARPRPIPSHARVRRLSETESVGGLPLVLVAARSEDPLRQELAELLAGMAVGLPLAAVLAALGGYALARRALRPLSDMAERARAITPDRLGERLVAADARDELGQLAAVFNAMLARLERAFDELRRFTADASHELRTPLTAMRAVGEVALREPRKGEEYREVIGSMLEEADRLAHLVEGLLTLSRADGGNVVLKRERVDLAELAREVTAHLGVLAEEKRQVIAVVASEPIDVQADRMVLRRALINLVDNAIKYTPEGGSVGIRVRREPAGPTIEVVDSGPGIGTEHRERIFDRFYRIDKARPRDGVGLGLAIARWAVETNGGQLDVECASGRGSTFRITFTPAGDAGRAAEVQGLA